MNKTDKNDFIHYLSGMAMQGLLANSAAINYQVREIVDRAYEAANAMADKLEAKENEANN